MNPDTYDLAVAYRICPRISKTPVVFAKDKLKLAELCLSSFKRSLGSLRAKVWVLLDDCPAEYEALFHNLFAPQDLVLLKLQGVGNFETFARQVSILAEQDTADIVYFAEDDYYYLPDALKMMVDFLRMNSDVDFVSPYDHPDCYSLELHREPSWIKAYGGRHWRTVASTCLSFLTTRENVRQTRHLLETYRNRNNDASIWFLITKVGLGLYNPFRMLHYAATDSSSLKLLLKCWWYGWRHLLFGPRRKLWTPMPSLGTHMESRFLAPGFDWVELVGREAITKRPCVLPSSRDVVHTDG